MNELKTIDNAYVARFRASLRDARAYRQRNPSDESLGYSRAVPTGQTRASPSPPAEIKPTGSATALPNFAAQITFVKAGHDGVDIETQRGAETAWTYLAFDSSSPYIDNRPPASPNSAATGCATATTTFRWECFPICFQSPSARSYLHSIAGVPALLTSLGTMPTCFDFTCPVCEASLRARARFAGQIAECPKCKTALEIPAETDSIEPKRAAFELGSLTGISGFILFAILGIFIGSITVGNDIGNDLPRALVLLIIFIYAGLGFFIPCVLGVLVARRYARTDGVALHDWLVNDYPSFMAYAEMQNRALEVTPVHDDTNPANKEDRVGDARPVFLLSRYTRWSARGGFAAGAVLGIAIATMNAIHGQDIAIPGNPILRRLFTFFAIAVTTSCIVAGILWCAGLLLATIVLLIKKEVT